MEYGSLQRRISSKISTLKDWWSIVDKFYTLLKYKESFECKGNITEVLIALNHQLPFVR